MPGSKKNAVGVPSAPAQPPQPPQPASAPLLPTSEALTELHQALPRALQGALQDQLTPHERIAFLALLAGCSFSQSATLAGWGHLSKTPRELKSRRVILKLERVIQFPELMAVLGVSDYEIVSKIKELMDCGDAKVEFQTTKLATQLKGHLTEKDTTPAATTIHLHVMPPPDGDKVVSQTEKKGQPVLNIDHLLDNQESREDK